MTLAPGTRVGPYETVAPLGAGGMGEVYRARDERLGRDVAIKVLTAEFAADPERLRRFEQEARAASALNHPNILVVHDVGSASILADSVGEGLAPSRAGASPAPTTEPRTVHYLVTELLEGETLRERLRHERLPWRKAVEIAAAVADGLAAAHGKGIIHRDLKPDNVFVTDDGRVKILDFGLARLAASPLVEAQTFTSPPPGTLAGAVLGTVGYMAPEQVRGEPADARSDIFALGCVLYEMLTGERAFKRDTAAETMTAILREPAPEVSASGIAATPELNRVVAHCLEKQPAERFQSASDVAFALRTLSTGGTAAEPAPIAAATKRRRLAVLALAAVVVLVAAAIIVLGLKSAGPGAEPTEPPRIVVLPFENLGSPENAYFASGMAEEITSRLANVQGLGVISRTSAVAYDRKGKTIKQIGGDLGVDYVLEGSVRFERGPGHESRVRITPQLIRVADDTHVWSDRYERVLADVFAIQSEVAESAVKAMGVTLLPREQTALRGTSTNDLEAYDLYLRGREFASRGEIKRDVESAVQMYQAAVHRDPRFAQALAGLATMNGIMYWEYFDRSPERLAKAKVAAERAVELRPDLAETHIALGFYFYHALLDYPRALNEFTAALRIQPNNSEARWAIGVVLRRQGRWAEAAEKFSVVAELDPKNAVRAFDFGFTSMLAGRYAEADRAYVQTLSLSPQNAEAYAERAWVQLLWHADASAAQAILDEADRVPGLTDDVGYLAEVRLRVALCRRDYQGALRQLEAETRSAIDHQNEYWPISLLRGLVHRLEGQHQLARRSFEAVRPELERRVGEEPDDHRLHGSLGIAFAGLGLRDAAVREARLGCALMPASKDALRAINRVEDLAVVYTMVGRPGEAIAALDDLLARSGWFSVHVLRLDPRCDPLRSDPRFQALLTKHEVRE